MTEKDILFGVFFTTDETSVNVDEVKNHFSKYGGIAFVKHAGTRVYINYRVKADAERCLLASPDPKFGVMKRGKFVDSPNCSSEFNSSQKSDRHSFPKKMETYDMRTRTSLFPHQLSDSRDGEFEESYPSREDASYYGNKSPRSRNDSINGKWNHSKRCQFEGNKSMQHFPDNPPPLLSVDDSPPPLLSTDDDGPPPLLSVDDVGLLPLPDDSGPPPLLSVYDSLAHSPVNCSVPPLISARESPHSTHSRPSLAPGLLPTPPISMRIDYRPEQTFSGSSKRPVQKQLFATGDYGTPPPLISVNSHSRQNDSHFLKKPVFDQSYDECTQRYAKCIIIANIPQNTTAEEIEKVLFPHVPLCVSDPEETNRKKVSFCLATFNTQEEASKAAKQLDGVELRKHCLNMIRLDELIMFSDEPF